MKFCEYCGSKIKVDSKFCEHCGALVPIAETQEVPIEDNQARARKNKRYFIKKALLLTGIGLAAILLIYFVFSKIVNKEKDASSTSIEEGRTIDPSKDKTKLPDDMGFIDNEVRGQTWVKEWYGYLWIPHGFGSWDEYTDHFVQAYMTLELDDKGIGFLGIRIDEEDYLINANVITDEDHIEVKEGYIWDVDLNYDDWWLALSPVDKGILLTIASTYIEADTNDEGGFEYIFSFRPYGDLWDEEINTNDMYPPNYDEYLDSLGIESTSKPSLDKSERSGVKELPYGKFTSATKTFTLDGITVVYPEYSVARENVINGIEVELADFFWVTAEIWNNSQSLDEIYFEKEYYLDYKDVQLYRSSYNGETCIVLIYDADGEYSVNPLIEISIPLEYEQMLVIQGTTMYNLQDMLDNPDFMVTLNNITWRK